MSTDPEAPTTAEDAPQAEEAPKAEKPAKKAAPKKAAKKKAAKKAAPKKADEAPAPEAKAEEAPAPEAKAEEAPAPEAKAEETVVSVEDALSAAAAEAPSDEERKVRRSRAVKKSAPVEGAADAGDEGESKSDKPRRPRKRRERKPREGKPGSGGSPIGARSDRTVNRMDVHPDVLARQKAEEEKRRKEEADRQRAREADKVTLILHPAPKQSGRHKKKKKALTAKEAMKAKGSKKGQSKPKKDKAAKVAVELKDAWLGADVAGAVGAIGEAGDGAEALVKAWIDAGNAAAVAAAASSDEVTGKARKAARRGLGVLKSRGVEIPEIEAKEAAPQQSEDEPVAAFIPPDSSGTVFFSISQRQKGGRFAVADVMYRHPDGVVHASRAYIAGRHIRNWEKRIQEQYGARPVTVPVSWARHCIAEAKKLNESSGAIVPMGFDSCAFLIEPVPEEAPSHPVADLDEDFAKEAIEAATEGSDVLHTEPEFRAWMPDRPAVDELIMKVGQRVSAAKEGDEEPSQDVVTEAVQEETKAATDRFFSPERREVLVGRMRDAAVSVRARVDDDSAKRILAVAKAVEQAGLVTSPPQEIPFLLAFFQKAVSAMVAANQGQLRVPMPQA